MDVNNYLNTFYILAGIVGGILAIVGVTWVVVKRGRPTRQEVIRVGAIVALIIVVLGVPAFFLSQRATETAQSNTQKITPTATISKSTPTTLVSPSSPTVTSSPSSGWHPLHSPFSPTCNDPTGTTWKLITPQANCMNGTLVMQQSSDTFAELDLSQEDGKAFNLAKFRVQVQITFLAPIDGNTTAAFDVQLAQPTNTITGYDFELYPDSTVYNGPAWAIEHIREGGKNDDKTGIDSGDSLTSVQSQVLTRAIMAIVVQDNVFICYVNGTEVGSHPLSSSVSAFGLMVARQHVGGYSPSPVQFTQFELDVPA